MNHDQNKKTLRQFQCRDYLWEIFEQMSGELECSVDYLINEAMRQYARSRNYGVRTPGPGTNRPPAASPPSGAPAQRPPQPSIPSAPPPPPVRSGQSYPGTFGAPPPQQAPGGGYPPPPAPPRPTPGAPSYDGQPPQPSGGGYPPPRAPSSYPPGPPTQRPPAYTGAAPPPPLPSPAPYVPQGGYA